MTTPAGTTLQKYLSTRQKISMTAIWVVIMGGIFAFAWVAPEVDGTPLFSITAIIGVIIAFILTFRIGMSPAGTPYVQITSVEGLRGEFNITRQWPALIGVWVGMIAMVCIFGILEEPRGAPAIRGWAITGIIALCFYGFLLTLALRRVTQFRIDDDGAVFIKRGRGDWIPLHVMDYQRIVGRTMSGKHATNIPTKIEFLDPVDPSIPRLSIPIMFVKSRRYGTIAYGTIIDEFFRNECKRAGHQMTVKPSRWEALLPSRKPKVKRKRDFVE